MARLSPGKNQPHQDVVYTPRPLAKQIVDYFQIKGVVLDPSRGEGAFYDALPDHCTKHYCEIDEGKDFFEFKQKVDWIITNPPWSKMREFIKHSMTLADNIVFLCTINHFTTRARLRDLRENDFGIREFYGVETPPTPWPQSGFQLVAAYLQRGWREDVAFTGTISQNPSAKRAASTAYAPF